MGDFLSLGLSDWLVKQCKQLGINKPTPVQENCMPAILEGKTACVEPSGSPERVVNISFDLILTTRIMSLEASCRSSLKNQLI